jgi:Ca-activated chloride channel homolog
VWPAPPPYQVGKDREAIKKRIDETIAEGGTALYDAIDEAYDLSQARARKQPGRIHAVVVMTDGRDEHSKLTLERLSKRFSTEDAPVKVFTISYGERADPTVLAQIAEAARGSSMKGAAETISQIYRDMAAFF